jgi:hypothetical protein
MVQDRLNRRTPGADRAIVVIETVIWNGIIQREGTPEKVEAKDKPEKYGREANTHVGGRLVLLD